MAGQREGRGGKLETPWTSTVLDLLHDWDSRAAASSETHYRLAGRLASRHIWFGIPVVVLTTFVGTSVFATLQDDVNVNVRILVGAVSVLAAVLASLQTFLRFAERAEQHRVAAEEWASIRRDIAEKLALHPDYLATRGDPQEYLERVRARMDRVSRQSPELGEKAWRQVQAEYGLTYRREPRDPTAKARGQASAAEASETPAESESAAAPGRTGR